jgi:enolase
MGKTIDSTTKTIGKSLNQATTQVGKSLTATSKAANKSIDSATKALGKHLDATAKAAAKAAKRPVNELLAGVNDEPTEFTTPALPAITFDFDRDFTVDTDKPAKRWRLRGKA